MKKKKITITIERDKETGAFIVSDNYWLVYGDAKSQIDAIIDYAECLLEYSRLIKNDMKTRPEYYKAKR